MSEPVIVGIALRSTSRPVWLLTRLNPVNVAVPPSVTRTPVTLSPTNNAAKLYALVLQFQRGAAQAAAKRSVSRPA